MWKPSSSIKVTKHDAAKRQLNSAIWLYFEEKDEISIHTLVSAGYDLIRDVAKNKPLISRIDSAVGHLIQTRRYLKLSNHTELFNILWKYRANKYNVNDLKNDVQKLCLSYPEIKKKNLIAAIRYELSLPVTEEAEKDPVGLVVEHLISSKVINDKGRNELFRIIRSPQNFFKHAEEDPQMQLDFYPSQSEVLLYMSCYFYEDVFEDYPFLFTVYQNWYMLNNSRFFTSEQHRLLIKWAEQLGVKYSSKKKYFEDIKKDMDRIKT